MGSFVTDPVWGAIHTLNSVLAYLFVMTKSQVPGVSRPGELGNTRTERPVADVAKCVWCRTPLPVQTGSGRPRRFCTQACKQWDWVARQRASELALSEDELVVTRSELDALRDQIFVPVFLHDDLNRNQLQNDHLNMDLLRLDDLVQIEHLVLFRNDKLIEQIFWQFLNLHADHRLV